jgi:alanine racemase
LYKKLLRPAWAEIDLDHIRFNVESIKQKIGNTEIIGVVKANAYGHGAVEVSRVLLESGVHNLGVATLQEAIELREAGIKSNIFLLGLVPWAYHENVLEYDLIPVVSSYTNTRDLSALAVQANKTVPVLVAVETGMGRIGVMPTPESIAEIVEISRLPNIQIKGLFSHFAAAEEADPAYTLKQLKTFETFSNDLKRAGVAAPYLTIANSAAIMNFPQSYYSAVRPGITLYGCYPSVYSDPNVLPLRPALSIKANIVFLKKMPIGCSISYGRHFTTERESVIATIPMGYADGYPRHLSNKGRVLIRGQFAPVVGQVCMDQCMIDVTDIPGVRKFDEVVLVGRQGDQFIAVEELADKAETISYEILSRLCLRLPRLYWDGGKNTGL